MPLTTLKGKKIPQQYVTEKSNIYFLLDNFWGHQNNPF